MGGHEIGITAEVEVSMSLDGRCVTIPVFVQPDSVQPCLLGTNAFPHLGLSVTRVNGESLLTGPVPQPEVAQVNLVRPVTIPGEKGGYLEAKVLGNCDGTVLFEAKQEAFEPLGVTVRDSLLSVLEGSIVIIPVENYLGVSVRLGQGVELGTVESVCERNICSVCGVAMDTECASGEDVNGHGSQVEVVSGRGSQEEVACGHGSQAEDVGSDGWCVSAGTGGTSGRIETILSALSLSSEGLTEEQLSQIKNLVSEFGDTFALDDSELGCTNVVHHHINTEGHAPIKQMPYRTPVSKRELISEMVDKMVEQGIAKPSVSPWASPVVLVGKRDGSTRFCVDYRRLNSVTRKDVYPLPRITDILDSVGDARFFSTLDLASGYWQVALDPETRDKTAFTTHKGLYEFQRMPFGLCNAPATFQRVMQSVLAGLEWKCCYVYIDDILVASSTFEEHLEHLRAVLLRLRKAGLRLKPKKCKLLQKEVFFLGHILSQEGIKPDPEKTAKVRDFPRPVDLTSLRQFLGLASYYRRFVPSFASVARPLNALMKKNALFEWSGACEDAFCHLKELLVTAPVLSYPKFERERGFILETDASKVGLGAILSQRQDDGTVHPIAYASRSLNTHERNYGISELETLGLVWAVRYFRPYLLGYPCTVYTDHAACLSILNTARPSGKLARWALSIQEMDLIIKHRPGKSNANADALSRNPVVASVTADEISLDMRELRQEQLADPMLAKWIRYLENEELPVEEKEARRFVLEVGKYEIVDGVLYFEVVSGRWNVLLPQSMKQSVLEEAHASCFGGHFAENKVYQRLRKFVWWKGMKADVRRFCRGCLVCATRKGRRKTFRPLLQPIEVGGPFHRVAVDVLQLPVTTSGNKYVIVFADYLTKWVEAYPTPDQTAMTIARLFVDNIVCRHGIPEQLLSDRGSNFLSELIQGICDLLGVKKLNTSGYHPQTDGLVEKMNSTIVNLIAKCCDTWKHDWDEHLQTLLFAYRSSVQDSTLESPFFMLYGRDPRIPTSTVLSQTRSVYNVDPEDYRMQLSITMAEAWRLAKGNIERAQNHQKKHYDSSSAPANLEIGERVMVCMPHEMQGKDRKLSRPFHGPYRVVSVTPTNAEVKLVDQPESQSIFVSLDRVRRCYVEQGDATWTGGRRKRQHRKKAQAPQSSGRVTLPDPARPVTRSMTSKQ